MLALSLQYATLSVMNAVASEKMICPRLTPETVSVFIAEDDESKVQYMLASLGEYGMAHSVEVADTYPAAEEYIARQVPGELTSNVFLLDGNLDRTKPGTQWHGSNLAGQLVEKFMEPVKPLADVIVAKIRETRNQLREIGLPKDEIELLIRGRRALDLTNRIARQQLQTQALLVGVSRVEEGALGYPAQIPRIDDYRQVGKIVFGHVMSPARLNNIAWQTIYAKRRQESIRNAAQS